MCFFFNSKCKKCCVIQIDVFKWLFVLMSVRKKYFHFSLGDVGCEELICSTGMVFIFVFAINIENIMSSTWNEISGIE